MFRIVFLLFLSLSSILGHGQNMEQQYRYVFAENGLRVRETPGKGGEVIMNLAYGTLVEIQADTDSIADFIFDNGQKIKGHWVKINYDENYYSTGYVFDAYLTKHLKRIPKQALHYFAGINVSTRIDSGTYENSEIDFWGVFYSKESTYLDDASFPRYVPNFTQPEFTNVELTADETVESYLKKYIKLELLENEVAEKQIQSRPSNNYTIERNINPKNLSETEWQNKFYVPIDGGRDSVLVEDYAGEGYVYKTYLGEIPSLNVHLILNQYEDCWVSSLDKTTGEVKSFFYGLPFLSPKGNTMISFDIDSYSEVSYLTIQKLDENGEYNQMISVSFRSWMPKLDLNAIFWISENEIIFEACPIDNFVSRNEPVETHYQYVKLTLF